MSDKTFIIYKHTNKINKNVILDRLVRLQKDVLDLVVKDIKILRCFGMLFRNMDGKIFHMKFLNRV